jgi:uncharacterized protein (DUF2235 family)
MPVKRLIICFDGTWNAADSEKAETNVARLARSVRANSGDDGVQQLVLYLRGVGTSGTLLQKLIAGATGDGVEDIIRSAYMFLAQNYVPARMEGGRLIEPDEIFLFGFSRGAFSARSLAGFISSCGLLKRQRLGDLASAWEYYREVKNRSPQDFMATCNTDCHSNVSVTFLGVWDTVGALGIPVGMLGELSAEVHAFHNTEPSGIVKHAAHALAIDEKRDEFVPTLWTGKAPAGSVIEQVWFAGCHSDVGGGYKDRGLADIPLAWMAKRAELNGLKLDWNGGLLPDPAVLDPLAPMHDSRAGWSSKDRLTPTIRRVLEKDAKVSLFERLYAPRDSDGNILPTINESLHISVTRRFGAEGLVSQNDDDGSRVSETYSPKNLTMIFNGPDQPKKSTRLSS